VRAPAPRILFRVASGPRRGFGHVVRALRLGAALRARVWISVSGPIPAIRPTRGVRLSRQDTDLLDSVRPAMVVLDTPVVADGTRWLRAARRRGLPVVSIHDGGRAPLASDLAVDGSLAAGRGVAGARRSVVGPRFMVVDPRIPGLRERRHAATTVVIALGGGPRRDLARRIGRAVLSRMPEARVVVAGGLMGRGSRVESRMTWLGPRPTIAAVLASASVAVVAGGVTLYEAAALRVPVVALPVVEAQRPTVEAFARAGAAVAANVRAAGAVAVLVAHLAQDRRAASAIGKRGGQLVDGRGALRVAGLIERLLARSAA
jgi:spore coat polysaccharide biosynthesis predicted glycosyltransferase SpsG